MSEKRAHIDKFFGSHDPVSEELMQKYINGELSPEEMHQVELQMVDDDLYDDALEGLELVKDSPTAASNVEAVKASIPGIVGAETKQRTLIPYFMAAAASIALLIAVYFAFNSGGGLDSEDDMAMTPKSGKVKDTKETTENKVVTKSEEVDLADQEGKNEAQPTQRPEALPDDGLVAQETIEEEEAYFFSPPVEKDPAAVVETNRALSKADLGPEEPLKNEVGEIVLSSKLVEEEKELSSFDDAVAFDEVEEDADENLNTRSNKFAGLGTADSVSTGRSQLALKNKDTQGVDYDMLSQEMLAMTTPVTPTGYVTEVTIENTKEQKAKDYKSSKPKKQKVTSPRYRTDSYQDKTDKKSNHKGKTKTASEVAPRPGANILLDARSNFTISKFDKSAGLYELVLQTEPNNSEALYGAGVSYIHKGNADKGLKFLHRIEKNKEYAERAEWYLSVGYVMKKNPQKAKALLKGIVNSNSIYKPHAEQSLKKLR